MRRDRYIATICRSLEISRTAADKRAGDDTANIIWFNQFKGDLANLVQPIQTKMLFVGGNLKHAIGRSIANRHAGFDVFFPEFGNDCCTRCMTIAKNTGQLCLLDQRIGQFSGEGRHFKREIAPIKINGHTRNFPMAAWRILTA